MALETATYISGLVNTNPAATDAKSQGDDHLRLLKSTLLNTFPAITGAVTPTHTELNFVDGVTSAIQTQIDSKGAITGQTWTGTHSFTGGVVTVATQTAADNSTKAASTAYVDASDALKADIASPTFTGTPTAPTAAAGTSTTQLATTAFVSATAFNAALPSQTGNSGKFVTTDGVNASWGSAVVPGAATSSGITQGTGKLLGRTTAGTGAIEEIAVSGATLSAGTLTISAPTAGQGSSLVYLSTVTASGVATADIETTIDGTYDSYLIVATGIASSTNDVDLCVRFKVSGAYSTGLYDSTLLDTTTSSPVFAQSSGADHGIVAKHMSSGAAQKGNFSANIFIPADTAVSQQMDFSGSGNSGFSGVQANKISACVSCRDTGGFTGVRFYMSAGNITGSFKLYGVKKS